MAITRKRTERPLGLYKIPPNLPLPKGGNRRFPLWKRGIKGDFMMILLAN
jgi:hypothetical protein